MTNDAASEMGEVDSPTLVELAVVLAAGSHNPSILNPDFLRFNGIVAESFEVAHPPVSTPAFSQVVFKNGVAVTADPARVIFTANALDDQLSEPPKIAQRYLQQVPHAPYRAVGINPKFFVHSPSNVPLITSALRDQGSWMSFKDVAPTVNLKFVYHYSARTIFLDIADSEPAEGSESFSGRLFQANVHRDVTDSNAHSRNEKISAILDGWEDDRKDVCALIQKFRRGE